MSQAHHRKKQPAEVRQQLLEQAAALAWTEGLSALRLEAVARAAGVSKGGLIHHFHNKQALLAALCDDFLARLDQDLQAAMQSDPEPEGRFVRAYLQVMSSHGERDHARHWAVLSVMLFAEPALRERWRRWLNSHWPAGGGDCTARIVRLAADGLWLSDLIEGPDADPTQREQLLDALRRLASPPAPQAAG